MELGVVLGAGRGGGKAAESGGEWKRWFGLVGPVDAGWPGGISAAATGAASVLRQRNCSS